METTNGPALVTAPDATARVPKLSREEMLELENYFLKIENYKLQMERQKKEMLEASVMVSRLQQELSARRVALSAKYGVDLRTAQIDAAGNIFAGMDPTAKAG